MKVKNKQESGKDEGSEEKNESSRRNTRTEEARGEQQWNTSLDRSFPPLMVKDWGGKKETELRVTPRLLRQARFLRWSLQSHEIGAERPFLDFRGHRLDPSMVKSVIWKKNLNCLVNKEEVPAHKFHVELLIDRSGSMHGNKIRRAKDFGRLICQGIRGVKGVTGRVSAFDDRSFWLLGDMRHNSIGSLEASNGNNDAGAIEVAVRYCEKVRAKQCIILMISDGLPTECSEEALKEEVRLAESKGYPCLQVAVDDLQTDCFKNFIDLSKMPEERAIAEFGNLFGRLATGKFFRKAG